VIEYAPREFVRAGLRIDHHGRRVCVFCFQKSRLVMSDIPAELMFFFTGADSTQEEAQQALEGVRRWTAQAGLTLHPVKTRIVDAAQPGGFDFLGYHFEQGLRWPRRKSERQFRDTIRAKTRRTHGQSLQATIADLNRTLVGWFGYFQHSHKTTFTTLDGWVRMRLRSIQRRWRGRKGPGRGADHQRWTNAYFAQHGLFSLVTAHATACQSSRR
jgi:RNA-directed DNA polymerase